MNLNKIIVIGFFILGFLYSSNIKNVDEYKDLQKIDTNKDYSNFKGVSNITDVSKFKNLMKNTNLKSSTMKIIDDKYGIKKTPEYKYLKKLNDKMNNGEINNTTFFYLYSESVPIDNIIRFAQEITLIKRFDKKARGYIVFRGLSGVENTIKKLKEKVNSPFFDYSAIASNIKIKLDPRFFQKIKAKKVPITVLAKCTNKNIFENCEFKFSQKGDVSLINFLNDVNLVDPNNYGKYYHYVVSPDTN